MATGDSRLRRRGERWVKMKRSTTTPHESALLAQRFVEEEEEDSISEDKTLLVYKHLPRFLLR